MATLASATGKDRIRRLPGEAGTWLFILGDMTVFAILFGVHLLDRGDDPALFATSQATLSQDLGATNTLILLTSSLLVVLAVRAVRHANRRHLAAPLLGGAMVCGLVFVVNKYIEYSDKSDQGIGPATNEFYMSFFVLTGVHLVHLICGLALLAYAIVLSRRERLTERQSGYVDGAACFWHMVDLLWIVLFPLLYLVH